MAIKDLIFLKQRQSRVTYIYGAYEDTALYTELAATPDGGLVSFNTSSFLEKWSAAGVLAWRVQISDFNHDSGTTQTNPSPSLAVSAAGDIYVAGRNSVSGLPILTKLSSTGAHVWTKSMEAADSSGGMIPTNISIDSVTGNIALGLLGATTSQLAVATFNTSGVLQWSRRLQNTVAYGDFSNIAYAPDGSLRVTGTAENSGFSSQHHLAKLSANGTSLDWVCTMDLQSVSASGNKFENLGVDSSGNAYASSSLTHTDYTEPTTVVKVSPTGALLWTRRCRIGDIHSASNMLVTSAGEVYLNRGGEVIKLSAAGATVWGRTWAGLDGETIGFSGAAIVGDKLHFADESRIYTAPTSGTPEPVTATVTPAIPSNPSFTFESVGVTNFALTGFSTSLSGASITNAFALTIADVTMTVTADPSTVFEYQA